MKNLIERIREDIRCGNLTHEQVLKLCDALDVAVEALKFYRDENNWFRQPGRACSAIIADTGIRAQKALKQYEGK